MRALFAFLVLFARLLEGPNERFFAALAKKSLILWVCASDPGLVSQTSKRNYSAALAICNRKHPLADYASPFSLAIRSTTFSTYSGSFPFPLIPSSCPAQIPL